MAIRRKVQYDIEVTGAARAADDIEQLDDAAKGAGSALRGSGSAAKGAAKDYARAEAEARGLGDAFDDVNERAGEMGGRFGDVRGRLGDLEDAVMVMSGMAFMEMGQSIAETITLLYGFTEAGRTAQQVSEALAESVAAVATEFASLDPKRAVELAKAMTNAGAVSAEYERRLQAATEESVRLAQAQKELAALGDVDLSRTGLSAIGDPATYRRLSHNIEISTGHLEHLTSWTRKAYEEAEEHRAALELVRAEIENSEAARNRLIGDVGREAQAWVASTAALIGYRMELQRNGGAMTSQLDVFARLASAGVQTFEGVAAAIDKPGAAATRATVKVQTLADEIDALFAAAGPGSAAWAESFVAGLPASGVDLADALGLTDPTVMRSMEEVGADHAAAYYDGLARQHDAAAAQLDTLLATNAAIRAGADAWETWADVAEGAIDSVASVLGSVRVAMDAILERELVMRRNAVASAQAQLQGAESAEERAAAEEKVYNAQLALQKAEEQASVARQRLKVLEFALEGAKMGAKAIEAVGLSQMLAALPFGVGAPFIPAAIAASVTYGAAAVAYGGAAVATGATPTAKSTPPQRPDSDIADSTINAGNRDRNRGGGGDTHVHFRGAALHTQTEIQETVVRALDEHGRRRGRATFDVDRVDRRSGGR